MLDKEDIQKLLKAQEEVFVTKVDFATFKDEYKEEFSKFLTKLDKKTGEEVDEMQEKTMLEGKVQRHEKWITQIAKKVDLKLES
jgi:hypothetical protein